MACPSITCFARAWDLYLTPGLLLSKVTLDFSELLMQKTYKIVVLCMRNGLFDLGLMGALYKHQYCAQWLHVHNSESAPLGVCLAPA